MRKWSQFIMVAAAALPTPVAAQVFDPAGRPLGADRRVSIGLTLPLGGGAGSAAKPQLELRTVADHRGAQTAASNRENVGWLPRPHAREARIGVTLSERPQLTVAGRELPEADKKLGISTVGWVAIGVAAAAVVGGVLFIDAVRDADRASD